MNEWSTWTRRGEKAPNAKLTQDQAQEYRRRYESGESTIKQLAAEAGVSYTTMRKTLHGTRYTE